MEENNKTDSGSTKSYYNSIQEWIAKMKLAFTNAKLPAILPYLQTVGYTEEILDGLLGETLNLEDLNQVLKKEQAEQYGETEKLNNAKKALNDTYLTHRGLCRVLFKKNLNAQFALGLNQSPKVAYADWAQLLLNFYGQLSKSTELKTAVAKAGITETAINTALVDLAAVQALKEGQKKETAEAQVAFEIRDKAFDALYEKYRELVDYAKVLLKDNQALEALGIVVKR